MNKLFPLVLASLVINCIASYAGTKKTLAIPEKPHNVKINLSAIAFRSISPQYEFSFHKNFSVAVAGRVMIPYTINPGSFIDESTARGTQVGKFNLTGFAITPEIRFYPGKKEENQAPHGFYLAPYFRYASYSIGTKLTLPDDTTVNFVGGDLDTKFNFSGMAGGLMMGAQWVFKNNLTFDWWIVGLHYGQSTFKATAQGELIKQASAAGQFEGSIEEITNNSPFPLQAIATIGVDNIQSRITGLPFAGLRAGFCLGYRF